MRIAYLQHGTIMRSDDLENSSPEIPRRLGGVAVKPYVQVVYQQDNYLIYKFRGLGSYDFYQVNWARGSLPEAQEKWERRREAGSWEELRLDDVEPDTLYEFSVQGCNYREKILRIQSLIWRRAISPLRSLFGSACSGHSSQVAIRTHTRLLAEGQP